MPAVGAVVLDMAGQKQHLDGRLRIKRGLAVRVVDCQQLLQFRASGELPAAPVVPSVMAGLPAQDQWLELLGPQLASGG